jgi:hypothetical protein
MAVTMTVLGAATPAGCARAAATTDREVAYMIGKLAFCEVHGLDQDQELAWVGLTAGSAIQEPREQKATPNVV